MKREKIISATSLFLQGKSDIKSYERDLKSVLKECDQKHQKTEDLVYHSFLEIAQNPGYAFSISKLKYEYLCRCICFLKTDFELETVNFYRFTWWNVLAIAISAIYIFLFYLGGFYRYLILPLSLILMSWDFLNPIYETPILPKYRFYPFKSENDWLLHKYFLEELEIDFIFHLKKFKRKKSAGNVCFYIYSIFLFPLLVFFCAFPQRCTYLVDDGMRD